MTNKTTKKKEFFKSLTYHGNIMVSTREDIWETIEKLLQDQLKEVVKRLSKDGWVLWRPKIPIELKDGEAVMGIEGIYPSLSWRSKQ